ncbi:MAD2-like 1-like protein [Cunninghamella echinulata]|nr:MAD2-like 1-like protein [Cunninghamella echinulata]
MSTNSSIALEGSADAIVEFLECGLNSILYQRGVYSSHNFDKTQRFGMTVIMSNNEELNDYIDQIIQQVRVWIGANKIDRLVLVIKSKETNCAIERWQFNINVNEEKDSVNKDEHVVAKKTVKEIQAIIRQITASVSFLPILEENSCTFNVLVYADKDVEVPTTWSDSDPNLIPGGGEHIRLKSFSTGQHKVDAIVAYRVIDDI